MVSQGKRVTSSPYCSLNVEAPHNVKNKARAKDRNAFFIFCFFYKNRNISENHKIKRVCQNRNSLSKCHSEHREDELLRTLSEKSEYINFVFTDPSLRSG